MKRSFLLLTATLLLAQVFAYDFSVNGIFFKIKVPASANKVAVTANSENGNSYSGNIVIPATVTYNSITYSVTEIDAFTFASSHSVTNITIPASVDTIGDGAFWGCIGLKTLAIPASIKKIGNYVFVADTTLTDITVDAANTNYKSYLGVLYNKNQNKLLTYPAGKPELNYSILSSVDTIADFAFSYCKFTSVTIPNGIKYMAHAAFCVCNGLTSVYLPASLTYLNNNPFYDCKNMTAINVDPANIYNESVDGVLFKKGLTSIIYYPPAKSGTSYIIPSTVNYVRSSVFLNCLGLTSITIPSSVQTIRSGMLQGCSNLTTINVYGSVPINLNSNIPGEDSNDVFKGVDTLHCVLHVPFGSKNLYASAFQWKNFSNIVEGFAAGFISTKASNLRTKVFDGQIMISGYSPGDQITIYNTQGIMLYKQQPNTPTTTINLSSKGIVLIKVGIDRIKVLFF